MNQWKGTLLALLAVLWGAAPAWADGIWNGENLLADRKIRVHDLVTVVRNKPKKRPLAQAKQQQSPGKPQAKASTTTRSVHGSHKQAAAESPASRVAKRLGRKFTARVIEVLPNGNLVLETKTQTQSGERVTTTIFLGEVRSRDVRENNTVELARISDIRLSVTTRRALKAQAKQATKPREKNRDESR